MLGILSNSSWSTLSHDLVAGFCVEGNKLQRLIMDNENEKSLQFHLQIEKLSIYFTISIYILDRFTIRVTLSDATMHSAKEVKNDRYFFSHVEKLRNDLFSQLLSKNLYYYTQSFLIQKQESSVCDALRIENVQRRWPEYCNFCSTICSELCWAMLGEISLQSHWKYAEDAKYLKAHSWHCTMGTMTTTTVEARLYIFEITTRKLILHAVERVSLQTAMNLDGYECSRES